MSRVWYFSGAESGDFRITSSVCLRGETLPAATHLTVAPERPARACVYSLCGVISNERYVTRPEKQDLVSRQVALGRPNATVGAFIPLKKSAAWWLLPQDERRKIFEADSKHIAIGLRALPQIARRLHHCRDLVEPHVRRARNRAPRGTRPNDTDLLPNERNLTQNPGNLGR